MYLWTKSKKATPIKFEALDVFIYKSLAVKSMELDCRQNQTFRMTSRTFKLKCQIVRMTGQTFKLKRRSVILKSSI